MTGPLAVFGGTFDPVHKGHLETAAAVRRQLDLDPILFVVNARPPHRQPPVARPEHRLAMLSAALADDPVGVTDDRELRRRGPSYTVWTLRALRAQQQGRSLALIVGADAYRGLEQWYQWYEVLSLAHLLVMPRPGETASLGLPAADAASLRRRAAGAVMVCDTPLVDVSASAIRDHIAAGRGNHPLLADSVWRYIQQHGLYGYQQSQ